MNYFEYIETGGIYEKEIVPEKLIPRLIYRLKKVIRNTRDEYLATIICVPIFLAIFVHLFGYEIVLSMAGFIIAMPHLIFIITLMGFIQPKYKKAKYRDIVFKNKL